MNACHAMPSVYLDLCKTVGEKSAIWKHIQLWVEVKEHLKDGTSSKLQSFLIMKKIEVREGHGTVMH